MPDTPLPLSDHLTHTLSTRSFVVSTPIRLMFSHVLLLVSSRLGLGIASVLCIVGCMFCTGCSWFQNVLPSSTSRRDRFVKQVISSSPALPLPKLTAALTGKSDASDDADHRVFALSSLHHVVVLIDVPSYHGYSESLTVYIPKSKEHEGDYRVSISSSAQGPWIPVGISSKTHTFDIDGTSMEYSRFVRIEVLSSSRTQLWLDALQLRVHTQEWRAPLADRPTPSAKEAKREAKQFETLWQQGQQAFQERQWSQARGYWRDALALQPRNPQVLAMLGATYHALERHYQAIRHYMRAFQYISPAREHLEEVADSYLALQEPGSARSYVEQCIDRDPFYLRCYSKRLHLASLQKNRLELALFREWYHIVKNRTHITQRQLSFRAFLAKYFDQGMPVITRYPQYFTGPQHLSWLGFLLRLFPQDTTHIVAFTEPGLLQRIQSFKKPPQQRVGQYYRAVYLHRIQKPSQSLRLLQTLSRQENRPLWLQRIYELQGRILEESGKSQQAQALYQKAHKRLETSPYGHMFFIKTTGKQISAILESSTKP